MRLPIVTTFPLLSRFLSCILISTSLNHWFQCFTTFLKLYDGKILFQVTCCLWWSEGVFAEMKASFKVYTFLFTCIHVYIWLPWRDSIAIPRLKHNNTAPWGVVAATSLAQNTRSRWRDLCSLSIPIHCSDGMWRCDYSSANRKSPLPYAACWNWA